MTVAPRVCLTAALAASSLALLAVPARADAFFQVQTTAAAVHLTLTQKPASSLITASLVDDAVGYAASDFDSGGSSEALAASAFPGRLVVQGPQLLCSEVFSCPSQPPDYPLLADASYPRRRHDQATVGGDRVGSGPFVATPLSATATAKANSNSGRTSAGRVSLLAGTPAAISVGASAATSSVRSTSRGVRVHVESTVHDVTIAGILHIESVRSVDDISVRSHAAPVNRPHITVAGVTLAGQRASIDGRGVHVNGTDGPSLTRKLVEQGVTVRTLGTHRSGTKTGARSDATGLQIDLDLPVKGTPYVPNPLPTLPPPFDQIPQLPGVNANGTYVGQVTLGAVGAAAGVGHEPTFDLGGVGTVPGPGSGSNGGNESVVAGAPPAGGGPGAVTAGSTPPNNSPRVAAPAQQPTSGIADLLSKEQLEILYVVLALGTAALFLGWRGSVLLSRAIGAGRGGR